MCLLYRTLFPHVRFNVVSFRHKSNLMFNLILYLLFKQRFEIKADSQRYVVLKTNRDLQLYPILMDILLSTIQLNSYFWIWIPVIHHKWAEWVHSSPLPWESMARYLWWETESISKTLMLNFRQSILQNLSSDFTVIIYVSCWFQRYFDNFIFSYEAF